MVKSPTGTDRRVTCAGGQISQDREGAAEQDVVAEHENEANYSSHCGRAHPGAGHDHLPVWNQ